MRTRRCFPVFVYGGFPTSATKQIQHSRSRNAHTARPVWRAPRDRLGSASSAGLRVDEVSALDVLAVGIKGTPAAAACPGRRSERFSQRSENWEREGARGEASPGRPAISACCAASRVLFPTVPPAGPMGSHSGDRSGHGVLVRASPPAPTSNGTPSRSGSNMGVKKSSSSIEGSSAHAARSRRSRRRRLIRRLRRFTVTGTCAARRDTLHDCPHDRPHLPRRR